MPNANNMVATVTDFKAQAYNGRFSAVDGTTVVEGNFTTSPEKVMTAFNGNVKADNAYIGDFNSWYDGNTMRFNISNADLDNMATVAAAIKAAKSAVEEEISSAQ